MSYCLFCNHQKDVNLKADRAVRWLPSRLAGECSSCGLQIFVSICLIRTFRGTAGPTSSRCGSPPDGGGRALSSWRTHRRSSRLPTLRGSEVREWSRVCGPETFRPEPETRKEKKEVGTTAGGPLDTNAFFFIYSK